jgi:hypothetical protein
VPRFIPSLQLAAEFYSDVVAPIVGGIEHSAALVGEGSEVLGFDSERSTDHSWGPRLYLFVDQKDAGRLRSALNRGLPDHYAGWPVRFYNWRTDRTEHHVRVTTMGDWLATEVGFDPRATIPTVAWLTTSQQVLLQATRGAVFRDDSGELTAVRSALEWFPRDVWLWLMACQWYLIERTEPLVGRTAEAGDDLGSRLAAARLAWNAMRLCFLQERRYAPYDKWLGTAFASLEARVDVGPPMATMVAAVEYPRREDGLVKMLQAIAERHNQLGLTPSVEVVAARFDLKINAATRPYRVINANRFVAACREAIADPGLRNLRLVGSIDQLTNATDLLINFTDWPRRLARLYEEDLMRSPG